jgi:hypothetical protein
LTALLTRPDIPPSLFASFLFIDITSLSSGEVSWNGPGFGKFEGRESKKREIGVRSDVEGEEDVKGIWRIRRGIRRRRGPMEP